MKWETVETTGLSEKQMKRMLFASLHKPIFFRYIGEPMLTRGDYGVRVEGGRSSDGITITAFDPDFGEFVVGQCGDQDWQICTRDEWENL